MVFELFLYGDDSKVLKDDSGSMKTIANLTSYDFSPFYGCSSKPLRLCFLSASINTFRHSLAHHSFTSRMVQIEAHWEFRRTMGDIGSYNPTGAISNWPLFGMV
jgi:hypothetical protein